MIKKLIGAVLAAAIMTTGAQAIDKKNSYIIINQCKYNLKQDGKYDSLVSGILIGLGQAYTMTLEKNGIDNDFASLTPKEYGNKMCEFALDKRKEENKKTGGKYDVTQFYWFLIDIGYYMTLPLTNDTNTTN